MDYSKLRATALSAGQDEEAVTVDTRALIDKVLARYSGEWTTLRELIQNAADAQASSVSIKWETIPSTEVPVPQSATPSDLLKHIIFHHTLRRLVVQNDGQPFTEKDWGRLKRIAEGNPDETKIGAFGVGFYSVFADCEEPFVSSGNQAMAFYWKGNSLFTRKSQLPADQTSKNTAFVLDYRNTTTPLPNLLSVSHFLATSLTFVALQKLDFWIDDYCILSLTKKSSPSADLTFPKELERETQGGLLTVVSVDRTSAQIDASYMTIVNWKPKSAAGAANGSDSLGSTETSSLKSFFTRLTSGTTLGSSRSKLQSDANNPALNRDGQDLAELKSCSIFLRVTTANVRTKIAPSFASELQRATKKPPPKTTKLSILTTSFDESKASEASRANGESEQDADIFASVLPSSRPGGRIFIGFPTMQTTGAGMHVSAPSIIPTVEREAIDLNARWVKTWNMELLRVTGLVSRLSYTHELQDMHNRMQASLEPGKRFPSTVVAKYLPEALHILNTFAFTDSTPNSNVGKIIEEAFWLCQKTFTIQVYSSQGVLKSELVRMGSDELNSFLDTIPVIPASMEQAPIIQKLLAYGLVGNITVDDIKHDLQTKVLTKTQAVSFIKWLGKQSVKGDLDAESRKSLLSVAITTASDEASQGSVIALQSIVNILNAGKVPPHLPVPPTTIPLALTATCLVSELEALGWQPLSIVPWLSFLLETAESRPEEESMTKSSKFALQVLTILSKNWDLINSRERDSVARLVKDKAIMPTKIGMKIPSESFFTTVKVFDDLPLIVGCEKIKDKFLVALGVRRTLDLDTIFTRLMNTSGGRNDKAWSHVELIKYLASVQKDIPIDDIEKLKESNICLAEATGPGAKKGTQALYKVSELFEPGDTLRALRLPLLHWPGFPATLRPNSTERNFLLVLGLRTHPSVPELVSLMASGDEHLRVSAMTFFIANHHSHGYGDFNLSNTSKEIMPLENGSQLVTPASCFTNERAASLGFLILRKDLHIHANKFGVAQDPPIDECIRRLLACPPRDHGTATTWFGYFGSRISHIDGRVVTSKLRDSCFIPVTPAKDSRPTERGRLRYICPCRTYLGSSTTYGAIFDFVDFGSEANVFLFHCGAKSEPTKLEVAQMLCSEPSRLLESSSAEKYLELLKSLAEATTLLQRDKNLWLKLGTSPCLLAYNDVTAPGQGGATEMEDELEAPIRQYKLASANQITVVDDIVSYRLFKEYISCAPEEDVLEAFYFKLGAQKLSSLVQEDVQAGNRMHNDELAEVLKKHVVERSKIFLHEFVSYRRDSIKHDSKWLDQNLRVEVVHTVTLRRTLQGQAWTNTEKRSAAGACDGQSQILYVADGDSPNMYQVGQALCHMLLDRPNQQSYLFFEPFLTLDLYGLRARGYNVDRILRAKAAEARIVDEQRTQTLEEEQKRIDRRENSPSRDGAQTPETTDPPSMPGGWASPEDSPGASSNGESRKSNNIFSRLGRRFGLDSSANGQRSAQHQPQALTRRRQQKSIGSSRGGNDTFNFGGLAKTQQDLLNAIRACQPHGSSSVVNVARTSEVKEQAIYCDSTSATNISLVAEASNGIKVFVAKELVTNSQSEGFLKDNHVAITIFASILAEIGAIYSLSNKVIHIFQDPKTRVVAFNINGSIFCNIRFFLHLHAAELEASPVGMPRVQAGTWWWVVFAHELSHNLVKVHDSQHSYYTESFIQEYMGKMMAKAGEWIRQGPAPPYESIGSPSPDDEEEDDAWSDEE